LLAREDRFNFAAVARPGVGGALGS